MKYIPLLAVYLVSASILSAKFIDGDFSSVGQKYDLQQKKLAEILGLTTISYKYTIPAGHNLEISTTLIDYRNQDYTDKRKITVVNRGGSDMTGMLVIYNYNDLKTGNLIFELSSLPSDGRRENLYFRLQRKTLDQALSANPALAFTSHPTVTWKSDTKALILEYNTYAKPGSLDPLIAFSIFAEIRKTEQGAAANP